MKLDENIDKKVKANTKKSISILISSAITSSLITLAIGEGTQMFARLMIMINMSLLAIPLALFVDIFTFPLWIWYIIILSWIAHILIGIETE